MWTSVDSIDRNTNFEIVWTLLGFQSLYYSLCEGIHIPHNSIGSPTTTTVDPSWGVTLSSWAMLLASI